jgi:hypothetical protein
MQRLTIQWYVEDSLELLLLNSVFNVNFQSVL